MFDIADLLRALVPLARDEQGVAGVQELKALFNGPAAIRIGKHFGGTGEAGRDAHYAFGQFAVYPTGNFEEHLKPFTEAAFHLDGPTDCASAVMPYYTVSYGVDKKNGKNVGNSYSEYLIKDLLRGKYEFKGIVCTDWGITQDPEKTIEGFGSRCYGVQDMTEAERCLLAITNGVANGYSPLLVAFFRTTPGLTAAMYSAFSVVEFAGRTIGSALQYRIKIPAKRKYGFTFCVYQV